jgi:hypothetical protein
MTAGLDSPERAPIGGDDSHPGGMMRQPYQGDMADLYITSRGGRDRGGLMAGSRIATEESAADVRAREVEEQMTDEERFSMIISVLGAVGVTGGVRDRRIPEDVPMSAACQARRRRSDSR